MSMFVVANLGDAAITLPSGSVNSGGTIVTGGFLFVNNTTAAPITLTLATGITPFLSIVDIAGNALTYPITISCSAGINAGTTTVISTNKGFVWLVWNGSSYNIVG